MADARERGDKWGLGMMLMLTAAVRLWSGRADAAIDPADESLALFRTIGDQFGESQSVGTLGRALVTSGRVADGFQVLHHGLEQFAADDFDERRAAVAAMLLLASTQVGDVNRAQDVLDDLGDGGWRGLGGVELAVGRALVDLQTGDADRAVARLRETVANEGDHSGFAHGALVFAIAAAGGDDDLDQLLRRLDDMPGSTYLDRTMAMLARELARAGAADEGAVEGFTELVAMIDETEDRCAQAIVRMGEALALDSFGLPTAEWALDEAERRLDELEISATGWRTACSLVLASAKTPAGA
jgi:hypothetical protein